ncbi:winged helix-turn-helix domain-containing protein, partial [Dermatophilus congolensis]
MARLLLMTSMPSRHLDVLPALGLLPHDVAHMPIDTHTPTPSTGFDILLIDARHDLARAKAHCRHISIALPDIPILAIVTEGGLITINADWGIDDILLTNAGPAEIDARIRLATSRRPPAPTADNDRITSGQLTIDESAYTARLAGDLLDLTYKEFELLKHLANHPGRAFTRAQLLQEVWGYDYFGGTRTVDVHIRRLRAKLGHEHEEL